MADVERPAPAAHVKPWRVPEKCGNCPFHSRGPGLRLRRSLRPGRWREILLSLRQGGIFPCHKTVQWDDEGERPINNGLYCAGALEWQAAHGCTSNYARVVERLGLPSQRVQRHTAPAPDPAADRRTP